MLGFRRGTVLTDNGEINRYKGPDRRNVLLRFTDGSNVRIHGHLS